jgi:hypothetical protein
LKKRPKQIISDYGLQGAQTRSYQPADWEVIDYQMFDFRGGGRFFRGPPKDGADQPNASAEKGSIAILGAAQIFGRFCEHPVSELIEEQTGTRVYNLGVSGGSPGYFLNAQPVIEFLANCRVVILQFLSARSVDNFLFSCSNDLPNRLTRLSDGETMFANDAYKWALANVSAQDLDRAVRETRKRYVQQMCELISMIPTKVHLLWFADRQPHYEMQFSHFNELFGGFPQLVNEDVVEQIKPVAAGYTEASGSRGRPHLLYNRFAGGTAEPVEVFPNHSPPHENYYYPTPQMHEDAARLINEKIRSGEI